MAHRTLTFALLAAFAALSTPALAQPALAQPAAPPVAVESDPHTAAMTAILASADEKVMLDNFVKTFAAQLPLSDPRIAALEKERPGLSAKIAEAMRPAIVPYSTRVTADFRAKVLLLMRESLTGDEARIVAQVFSSPAMKKMMRIAVANASNSNVVREAMTGDGTITADAARADNRAAVAAAMEQMTEADFAELAKLPITPALSAKMGRLGQRVNALRVEMENIPPLPEEARTIEAAVEAALVKYLAGEK